MLAYRSEDIKNVSRLQSPKVCGYVKVDDGELIPKGLIDTEPPEGELCKLYSSKGQCGTVDCSGSSC